MRDIEELLFERGVVVSYETIRRWCDKFGASFAHRAKAASRKPGSTWHLDEVFVTLRGELYSLGRAVDQRGTSGQAASTRLKKRHPPPSESQRHRSLSRPRTLNVTTPAERMEPSSAALAELAAPIEKKSK